MSVNVLAREADAAMPQRLQAMKTLITRFWERVNLGINPGDCWLWLGGKTYNGYGLFGRGRSEGGKGIWRTQRAHRISYELTMGEIPDGLTLDHLCRNRLCVNPAHLEPVTRGENVLRGETIPRINHEKTACKNGHEFTESNIYRRPDNPRWRGCLKCRRSRSLRGCQPLPKE